MERIGIAASKIAKGNLGLYNFCVILLSCLFSLLVFIIAGSTLLFAFVVIFYLMDQLMPEEAKINLLPVLSKSLICLAVIIGLFNLWGIVKNIKIHK